jgi:hypothetical protein
VSMQFTILLRCISCECLGEKKYRAAFTPLPSGPEVWAEFDCSVVPGTRYELLLKGMFPPHCDGRPCVGEFQRFKFSGDLTAVDRVKLETEEWERQNNVRGK